MSMRVLRRTATAAVACVLSLSGVVVSASSAQAANFFFVTTAVSADGSRSITVRDGTAYMGYVSWNADPGGGRYGDSVYVRDGRSDGYALHGEVRYQNGNRVSGLSVGTAGKTAPVIVRATKNVTEGTKLKLRACITKGGSTLACSAYETIYA